MEADDPGCEMLVLCCSTVVGSVEVASVDSVMRISLYRRGIRNLCKFKL